MILRTCLVLALASFTSAIPQGSATAEDITRTASSSSYGSDQANVNVAAAAAALGSNYVGENFGAPSQVNQDDSSANCTRYAEYGYKCVPYYLCNGGYVVTDGGGIIDIRSGFNEVELNPEISKCDSYLEVCCRDPAYTGPLPTFSTTTPAPKAPYQRRCGRRNHGGVGVRIQNGEKGSTQYGEWPHMCAVLKKATVSGESVNLYVCGASLIAPGVALTGAHCVDKVEKTDLKVRCGEWDTQQNVEPERHQDRDAIDVSIHPEFNPSNLQNDFAIIHLESEFNIGPAVDTICLPDPSKPEDEQYIDHDCYATGWGKDKFGKEGNYQVILKQVKMDMVRHGQCQNDLRTTRLGQFFKLDKSFTCAGGLPGKDTCKGDGGGPLVCPTQPYLEDDDPSQVYVQSGIVAWGIGCGTEIPGVYAKVSAGVCFIDWATRCVRGQEADYYNLSGCKRWAKKQYCTYKEKIPYFKSQLDAGVGVKERGEIISNLAKMERALPLYEKAITGCNYGPQDYDCSVVDYDVDYYNSDDIDISSHARDSVDGAADTRSKIDRK